MKFYWFFRHNYFDLKDLFENLENTGFDGVLLAYAQLGDPFSALANKINPNSSMEYIVAVRPYLISPQYVSEIVKSFESFAPGKLSINLVPGNVLDSEKEYGGVIGETTDLSSQDDRRDIIEDWIKEYISCRKNNNKIYISGHHPDIVEYADQYFDSLIMNHWVFNNDYGYVPTNKKFYVAISPFLEGDISKATPADFVSNFDILSNRIKELEKMGVSGIFFHNPSNAGQLKHILNFVKKYREIHG